MSPSVLVLKYRGHPVHIYIYTAQAVIFPFQHDTILHPRASHRCSADARRNFPGDRHFGFRTSLRVHFATQNGPRVESCCRPHRAHQRSRITAPGRSTHHASSVIRQCLEIDYMDSNPSVHTLIAGAIHAFEPAKQMTSGQRCDLALLLRNVVDKAQNLSTSVEQDRTEFETWFAKEKALTEELAVVAFLRLQSDPRCYHCWEVQAAWKLWLGARGRAV